MTRTIILDNESVQALMSVTHGKHRKALAQVQVVATRKKKGAGVKVVVPTTVRAEAGWDRTAPAAALINLLGIIDVPLDRTSTDVAASLAATHDVSVADAHMGATISLWAGAGPVTVVSSDPHDTRTVAGSAGVVIVTL